MLNNPNDIVVSGVQEYLDVVCNYGEEKFYEETLELLSVISNNDNLNSNPIIYFLKAYYQTLSGDKIKSQLNLTKALSLSVDGCFPFRIETQKALEVIKCSKKSKNTFILRKSIV